VLIGRWEEHLLESRLGAPYRAYQSRVNAWLPRVPVYADLFATPAHSWRETFFSERGTLIAVVVMATVLSAKILLT
jgi:hypothetical protein